jgi:signal transduction histidine kinase
MRKLNILWLVLFLIFLIVFNTLFFVLSGTENSSAVWISYGFIHFAYFMIWLTPYCIDEKKNITHLGFSLYSLSTVYFLLQFITGTIIILIAPTGYKFALFIQVCYAGLFGIFFVIYMIANKYTAKAVEERQINLIFIKEATQMLKSILMRIDDKDMQRQIEKVYDEINSSPVKSHDSLRVLENDIMDMISQLQGIISSANRDDIVSISGILLNKINERNMSLKRLH